jgi:hypothetical protein
MGYKEKCDRMIGYSNWEWSSMEYIQYKQYNKISKLRMMSDARQRSIIS